MADPGSRKSISSGLPVAKKPTGIPTPSGSGTTQSRLPTGEFNFRSNQIIKVYSIKIS